jgi:ParB-like chromosome segregation protein Spo0J
MTAMRSQVRVDSIVVDDQFGRYHDASHTEMYAEIIAEFGLQYPITVDKELKLLAGDRWLAAVKKLEWESVEVLIVGTRP